MSDESELTIRKLNDLMLEISLGPKQPDTILVGRPQYAALRAAVEFQGRDRRRIKREIAKAFRAARKLDIAAGIPKRQSDTAFWFNREAVMWNPFAGKISPGT